MRLFCIIPTLGVFPQELVQEISKQKRHPDQVVIGIDEAEVGEINHSTSMFTVITFTPRAYSAYNICRSINYLSELVEVKNEDIICLLDGDDNLYDDNSLLHVYRAHELGAWVTYGSYINKSAVDSCSPKLHRKSYRNAENYRELPWRASHIKSFRYGLYRKLDTDWYTGLDGNRLKVCSDLALMFPILEMAGKSRVQHINKPLYIYNDMSPLNEHKVRGAEQKDVEMWLRSQKPYKRIGAL